MEVDNESCLDISKNELALPWKDLDDIVDNAIFIVQKDTCNNKEKTHNIDTLLEKLEFNINELPSKKITEMKTVFEDNEVLKFNDVGSCEMVSINPLFIAESLKTNKHLAGLSLCKFQYEAILSKFHNINDVVQGELDREKAHADLLHQQIDEKSVLRNKMKMKLDEAQREHQKLEALLMGTERPRYTLENLDDMLKEVRTLEEDLAITSTRLKKYNNLPLSEREAAKQLKKVKQEISDIDNEMKNKVNCEM